MNVSCCHSNEFHLATGQLTLSGVAPQAPMSSGRQHLSQMHPWQSFTRSTRPHGCSLNVRSRYKSLWPRSRGRRLKRTPSRERSRLPWHLG
eukprot:scaffold40469_cov19-Prasinocladus_malaysianus.AAC.1